MEETKIIRQNQNEKGGNSKYVNTSDERHQSDLAQQDGTEDAEFLKNLLFLGQENHPSSQPERRAWLQEILSEQIRRFDPIEGQINTCRERLCELGDEIKRMKTDDSVLTQLSDQCRKLTEQFHEREFLNPVFFALIGIADRCRQQTADFQELLDKHNGGGNKLVVLAMQRIISFRNADRTEVESILANHGVTLFVHQDEKFNSAVQKCINRIPCNNQYLHGCTAKRLLPGYQRYGKILRPECVEIYVVKQGNTVNDRKGDTK